MDLNMRVKDKAMESYVRFYGIFYFNYIFSFYQGALKSGEANIDKFKSHLFNIIYTCLN
jgi:hypothetical protein